MEEQQQFTQTTRDDLRKTSGWMRFYAIVLFLLAAFCVYIAFQLATTSNVFMDTSTISLVIVVISIVFILMGGYLYSYANKLAETAQTGQIKVLENAFNTGKTFFIIWGVFAIVSALWSLYSFIPVYF